MARSLRTWRHLSELHRKVKSIASCLFNEKCFGICALPFCLLMLGGRRVREEKSELLLKVERAELELSRQARHLARNAPHRLIAIEQSRRELLS